MCKKKSGAGHIDVMDELLQGADVVLEGDKAVWGDGIAGIGFTTDEGFLHTDVVFFFEGFEVAGQVAVGQLQGIFECDEVDSLIDGQHGHDAQADAVFKSLIELIDIYVHRSCLK